MDVVQRLEALLSEEADDFTISKIFKEALSEYKSSLSSRFEASGGKDFLVQHTKNIDALLTLMYKTVLRRFFGIFVPMRNSIPITFVALGSYGREQLALHSDIDLMIVYKEVAGFNTEAIIKAFLHIAWDARLDLGHRVHEVDDLVAVSKEDITIKTALMESRFITGSQFVWQITQQQIEIIRKTDPKAYIQAKLDEAQARHEKYPRSMQPHIKEGVGGLRDAHLLSWVAFVRFGVGALRDLSGRVFSDNEYKEYRMALEFLYAVRSSMHLVHKKKKDQLVLELIPDIATKLGFSKQSLLMSKVLESMHTINLFSRITLAKMTRYYTPCPHFNLLRLAYHGHGMFLIQGRVFMSLKKVPLKSQALERKGQAFLEALGTLPDVPLAFDASVLLHAKALENSIEPEDFKAFFTLLKRRFVGDLLELFYDAKILEKLVPPLTKVIFLAQFDGYHHYPVGMHSIETVKALAAVNDPHVAKLYDALNVHEQALLKLIMLLHDAGKGRVQNHHEVGARLFKQYGALLDLAADELELGAHLIKYHTYMSNIAFREDIFNERVLFGFMSLIGNVTYLQWLYMLTYADISGVGPDVYTPFSANLIHKLYENACEVVDQEARLSEAAKRLKKEQSLQKNRTFLELPKTEQKKILAIVSNLFFIKYTPTEILELAHKAQDVQDYTYYISNEKTLQIEIFRTIPLNLAFLLSKLNALSITSMDVFKLYNDLKYFRIEFERTLSEQDLPLLEQTIKASFDMRKTVKLPDVTIANEDITLDCDHSKTYANLQINTKDQKGLLQYIMTVFETLHVDIATAKIHTIKKQVRDQFLIEKSDNLCHNAAKITQSLINKV